MLEETQPHILPAGTICTRNGIPFELAEDTVILCHPANIEAITEEFEPCVSEASGDDPTDVFGISKRTVYVLVYAQSSKDGSGRIGDMATFPNLKDAQMTAKALQASVAGSKLSLPDRHE